MDFDEKRAQCILGFYCKSRFTEIDVEECRSRDPGRASGHGSGFPCSNLLNVHEPLSSIEKNDYTTIASSIEKKDYTTIASSLKNIVDGICQSIDRLHEDIDKIKQAQEEHTRRFEIFIAAAKKAYPDLQYYASKLSRPSRTRDLRDPYTGEIIGSVEEFYEADIRTR